MNQAHAFDIERAKNYVAVGDCDRAMKILSKLPPRLQKSPAAAKVVFDGFAQHGHWMLALKVLANLPETDPARWTGQARCLLKLNLSEAAHEVLSTARKRFGNTPVSIDQLTIQEN
jgi:hypothetical protein